MAKKRGLGKGLEALLGAGAANLKDDAPAVAAASSATEESNPENYSAEFQRLAIDVIQRGRYQPRRDFNPESLQELADSIAAQGVVQPIVVRPIDGKRYEIIAGERRWRAAQQAGLDEIPVVIRDVPDQTAMAMGLIENIQRDDLNPLEEATALHRLLNEFELTHQLYKNLTTRGHVNLNAKHSDNVDENRWRTGLETQYHKQDLFGASVNAGLGASYQVTDRDSNLGLVEVQARL